MNFEQSKQYIDGRLRFGWKFGNERLVALLDQIGNPHQSLKVFHVAGTKGKGSTSAFLASILRASGQRTGLYLSPYVFDLRERIQIDGQNIPEDDFARLLSHMQPAVDSFDDSEFGPITEFELKTALGFAYFADQNVDYAVIEVGLGGRLDATNVVDNPISTVITNIGYDHVEILGHTLPEIAREKAGIIKRNAPCVTGVPQGTPEFAEIEKIAAAKDSILTVVAEQSENPKAPVSYRSEDDRTVSLWTRHRALEHVKLGMAGQFQHGNAVLAAAAVDAAKESLPFCVTDEMMRSALETTTLPGRLQTMLSTPTVVVDVAHNDMSATALKQALVNQFNALERRLILVVGMSHNHAPETFLEPLAKLNPAVLIACQPLIRSRNSAEVAASGRELGIRDVREVKSTVTDAAALALSLAQAEDLICLTGSFYTVGEVTPQMWHTLAEESK